MMNVRMTAAAVALVGCMGLAACSASTTTTSTTTGSGTTTTTTVTTTTTSGSAGSAGSMAGVANPWSDLKSAAEVTETSGVPIEVNEEPGSDLGKPHAVHYRAMEGLAEIVFEYPACEVTVRKGTLADYPTGDCSGMYETYAHEWKQTINGIELNCAGNVEGDATVSYGKSGDYAISVVATPGGGDDNFGLNTDRLTAHLNAVK